MGRNQNLKPFTTGVSGNPNGRPKGTKSLTSLLSKMLDKKMELTSPITGETNNLTLSEHIVLSLISKAINGDSRAIKEIFDRTCGKSPEIIKHEDNVPFEVRHNLTKEQIDAIVKGSREL